jgi:hypothetical protein
MSYKPQRFFPLFSLEAVMDKTIARPLKTACIRVTNGLSDPRYKALHRKKESCDVNPFIKE